MRVLFFTNLFRHGQHHRLRYPKISCAWSQGHQCPVVQTFRAGPSPLVVSKFQFLKPVPCTRTLLELKCWITELSELSLHLRDLRILWGVANPPSIQYMEAVMRLVPAGPGQLSPLSSSWRRWQRGERQRHRLGGGGDGDEEVCLAGWEEGGGGDGEGEWGAPGRGREFCLTTFAFKLRVSLPQSTTHLKISLQSNSPSIQELEAARKSGHQLFTKEVQIPDQLANT